MEEVWKRTAKDKEERAEKLTVKIAGKLKFSTWVDEYQVNLSLLADNIGCSRQTLHAIKKGTQSATLSTALSIFYWSGGLVSMFSMLRDGDALSKDLARVIKSTHTLHRSKINRKNRLVRYNLRKL